MEFIKALEGYGLPIAVVIGIIAIFLLLQLTGEIIEWCGKTAPVWLKVRKAIAARKEAKQNKANQEIKVAETLAAIQVQYKDVNTLLTDVKEHYDEDNIAKRDKWMLDVNTTMNWARERAVVYDASVKELQDLIQVVKKQSENIERQQVALELNNKMTSDMYKQNARGAILDFSHKLVNARKADKPVIFSREEFRKIHKTYDAYEEFLNTYGGTNGEVEDAMKIIRRAERYELPNIEFLEDLRD